MLIKSVKQLLLTASVLFMLLAVSSVVAFAERMDFNTNDMESYEIGANPAEGLWYANYIGGGYIGASKWDGQVQNVYVDDKTSMRFGKVFRNAAGQNFSMYYKLPNLTPSNLIKIENGSPAAYYIKWTTYLPDSGAKDVSGANSMIELLSSAIDNNTRCKAGIIYNGSDWVPGIKATGMSGKFNYGEKRLTKGKMYTCILKLASDAEKNVTCSLKIYEYGHKEPSDYDLTLNYKSAEIDEKITTLRLTTYNFDTSALQMFGDIQIDGYTKEDIENAAAVFDQAAKINPTFGEIRSREELTKALCSYTLSDGIKLEWSVNKETDLLAIENGSIVLNDRPEFANEQLAVTAKVSRGNAVTYKTFPITVKAKLNYSEITPQKLYDGRIVCSARVTNETDETIKTPVLMVCRFRDGKLVSMETDGKNDPEIEAGTDKTLSVTLDKSDKDDFIKAFLWDGFGTMKPLNDFIYKKASEIYAVADNISSSKVKTDFKWTVGNPVELDSSHGLLDGEASYIKDGNDIWMLYSEYTKDGTVQHKRFKGTSLDDLQEQENGHFDNTFDKPHGDDKYWLCGLWADPDSDKWYALIHDEYNYSTPPSHVRNIQLAESNDKGITWTNKGVILTSDDPDDLYLCPGRYAGFGSGDQKLFVDERSGYFYLYYMNGWIDRVDGNFYKNIYKTVNVARAPISGKMAPGTWQKWYNGEWSQPGIGGHDSPLFNPPSTATFVTYNTYLDRYVAFGMKKPGGEGFISTCTDINLQNWTEPVKFMDAKDMHWYQWVIDPKTADRHTTGKTFRLYGGSSGSSTNNPPTYREITFENGSQSLAPLKADYSFFTDPVFDYNAPFDAIPSDAYREDFIDETETIDSWAETAGSAKWKVEDGMLSGEGSGMLIAEDAPALENGHFVFSVAVGEDQKFGIIFRYASDSSYALIRYEDGEFKYVNGENSRTIFKKQLKKNRMYRVDVDFNGEAFSVSIDNTRVYTEENVTSLPTEAGKPGFEVFGSSKVHFDNMAYYDGIIVQIDSLPTAFEVQPISSGGKVMVPAKEFLKLFGTLVIYSEPSGIISVKKDGMIAGMKIGETKAVRNGQEFDLPAAPVIVQGRPMIPLTSALELVGAELEEWDGIRKTAFVNSNGKLATKRRTTKPLEESVDNKNGELLDKDFTLMTKQSDNWTTKNDYNPELGVAFRMYRNTNDEAYVVYKRDVDIKSIKVKTYHSGEDGSNLYKFYVSNDGEKWNEMNFKNENPVKDATNSMYFSDMLPNGEIPEGMKYFKIVALSAQNNWCNQLARVEINR